MIYYCIPTHNEEKTVGVVLWKIRHVMAELPRDYQILVGDDASTDRSSQVLEPYRRVLPLVLLRNGTQRGYAATLEMLLRQAVRMSRYPKRDAIVVLQADFTDDIDGAGMMLRRIESGADIATGGPVTDAVRPGFFERLARGYARRVLSRFEWPEHVDPLNGLNVYRLMCVKRAIEEGDGNRLLAWDGAAANAALLRAALPHARRIETVEINRHSDRAQRSRRFKPLTLVGQIRRFASGAVPSDLASVSAIDPDDVRGDLSVLHGPAGNGDDSRTREARSSGRSTTEDRPARRSRRSGTQSSSSGSGRRRTSEEADGGTGNGKPRRRRKPRSSQKPRNTTAADGTVTAGNQATDAGTTPNAEAPAGSTAADARTETAGSAEGSSTGRTGRSRRGRRRRGGSRNRKPRAAGSTEVSGSEDTTGRSDPSESGSDATSTSQRPRSESDGQVIDSNGDTENKPARRRRGRRGGRNRRGGRRRSGTNDATKEEGSQTNENPEAEGSS